MMEDYLLSILSTGFKNEFSSSPKQLLEFFDNEHEADHRSWNQQTKSSLLKLFEMEAKPLALKMVSKCYALFMSFCLVALLFGVCEI